MFTTTKHILMCKLETKYCTPKRWLHTTSTGSCNPHWSSFVWNRPWAEEKVASLREPCYIWNLISDGTRGWVCRVATSLVYHYLFGLNVCVFPPYIIRTWKTHLSTKTFLHIIPQISLSNHHVYLTSYLLCMSFTWIKCFFLTSGWGRNTFF